MRNNRRDATSGAFSAFRVSEWSVRRKVVAVLAIPVVLAAVFGGLRVSSELQDASGYSTNQQRATVLGPAIAYLAATERLALPSALSDALDGDAKAQYTTATNDLKSAAGNADLTRTRPSPSPTCCRSATRWPAGAGRASPRTRPCSSSDMTQLTTRLINSTLNTEGTPDPQVQA